MTVSIPVRTVGRPGTCARACEPSSSPGPESCSGRHGCRVLLELFLVEGSGLVLRVHPMNPDERDKVQIPIRSGTCRKWWCRTSRSTSPDRSCRRKAGGQLPHTQSQEGDEYEDDGGVSERKPETDGHRFLAVRYQLPSGVVDSGDVIGVESMAHAERVRRDTESDAEDTAFDRVVAGTTRPRRTAHPTTLSATTVTVIPMMLRRWPRSRLCQAPAIRVPVVVIVVDIEPHRSFSRGRRPRY